VHGVHQVGRAFGIGSDIGPGGVFRLPGRTVTGSSVNGGCRNIGTLRARHLCCGGHLRAVRHVSCVDSRETGSEFEAGGPVEGGEPLAVQPLAVRRACRSG
jgi:hypothetical protein